MRAGANTQGGSFLRSAVRNPCREIPAVLRLCILGTWHQDGCPTVMLPLLPPLALLLSLEVAPKPETPVPACMVDARLVVKNQTRREVMVLSAGLSTDRFGFEFGSAVTALPPGGTWQSPRSLRLLSTAEHRLFVRVRQGARQWRVQRVLRPNTGLVSAAKQQCAQSSAADTCDCRAPDAGKRCTDGKDCAGRCLFDRIELVPNRPCVSTVRTICPIQFTTGFEIGHCSAERALGGCHLVIADGASAQDPRLQPSPRVMACFDWKEPARRP